MNKEHLEKGFDVEDAPEGSNYQRYLELGGIINEKDYDNALAKAKNTTTLDKTLILQAENLARISGIELHSTENAIDLRAVLYGILRSDVRPEEVKHHHGQMSDQQIFMEALRMLGDTESMDKVVKIHPHISFEYERGDSK